MTRRSDNKPKTIANLFKPKPIEWGLRGDPYLWAEMTAYFEGVTLPEDVAALRSLLEAAFETLTGQPITAQNDFFLERLAHGGMSSGYVSPAFWQDRGIPLLCSRFEVSSQ